MDRGVSVPVDLEIAAQLNTYLVIEKPGEKMVEMGEPIKRGEDITVIESKVIPIQATHGVDATTHRIRVGVLCRKLLEVSAHLVIDKYCNCYSKTSFKLDLN